MYFFHSVPNLTASTVLLFDPLRNTQVDSSAALRLSRAWVDNLTNRAKLHPGRRSSQGWRSKPPLWHKVDGGSTETLTGESAPF